MDYPEDLSFLFYSPTKVIFGPHSSSEVSIELQNLGCSRAVIVTDPILYERTEVVGKVKRALGSMCVGVFPEVPPDSSVHAVDFGAQFAKSREADSLISVGGGSAIDTAKAMAILLKEGGSLLDYQGFQVLSRPQTPHISIPTTAGSGSGVTYVALIKDHLRKQKLLFADHYLLPKVAILDPFLTVSLPPRLTAATGMDALSHAVEALTSAQRTPLSDALALHAIRLIHIWLPEAVKNGKDISARGQMLIASTMAGMAFSNAQVGLAHAIAHVVGARHGLHHGTLNALLMPHVIRYNNEVASGSHALIAEAMGVNVRGMPQEAAGLEAAEAICRLNQELDLPIRLRDLGIPEVDLDACAEMAIADGAIVYNAKPVNDPIEVLQVMRAAW